MEVGTHGGQGSRKAASGGEKMIAITSVVLTPKEATVSTGPLFPVPTTH